MINLIKFLIKSYDETLRGESRVTAVGTTGKTATIYTSGEGLPQGCEMSSRFINIYTDGVTRVSIKRVEKTIETCGSAWWMTGNKPALNCGWYFTSGKFRENACTSLVQEHSVYRTLRCFRRTKRESYIQYCNRKHEAHARMLSLARRNGKNEIRQCDTERRQA